MEKSPFWHSQTDQEVLQACDTSMQGLTLDEAAKRLAQYGPNRLPQAPQKSALMRFLLQFHNILIYVLLAAGAVTAFLGHFVDTMVILAVVVANAIIGYIQEGKAQSALEAIKQMLSPHAAVIRAGQRHTIDGEAVVVGDIVLLEAGDKVP
ncbi:MAG: hypothetical protein KU37_11900, partial [Sulfuricurvum sp. PC08-66]